MIATVSLRYILYCVLGNVLACCLIVTLFIHLLLKPSYVIIYRIGFSKEAFAFLTANKVSSLQHYCNVKNMNGLCKRAMTNTPVSGKQFPSRIIHKSR